MPYEEESVVAEWMNRLKDLNVSTKKMFGCYCLYCDGQAVGWIHDSVLSLREVGLTFLPMEIIRPGPEEKVQELVIPFDYVNAEWLPKAVQNTADIRKKQTNRDLWRSSINGFERCKCAVRRNKKPLSQIGEADSRFDLVSGRRCVSFPD